MPPRRRNTGNRGTPGQLSDPYETLESRIKRLRGDAADAADHTASQTTRVALPVSVPAASLMTPHVTTRPAAAAPQSTQVDSSVPADSYVVLPLSRSSSAARSDVPNVRNLRRGSASVAVSELQHHGLHQLVNELIEDRYAKTSKGPLASYRVTWTKFHRLVYGPDAPIIPLTVECIVAVASLFKKGGYRGFGNYMTAVKALHIEADHPWSDLLGHTVTWVTRSVE